MVQRLEQGFQAAFRPFILTAVRSTANELGRGSYAVVLELEYRGLKCAGKKLYRILHEQGIGHAARRYLEECRLLSQTRHPNIVQFLGVYFEEGSEFPILVMELLPTNLTSCLDRYGILPDEISYSILHGVALGLSYLHGQTPSIIHRDLSANNVLLSYDMTAKISDLGVARILNLTPLQVSRMTETPGTPAYMPPEVMIADPHYDTSVDEFSYGVMMVHVFTAEWPLPKVGPNRVDLSNPDVLIPVSEAERREEFIRKIGRDHPLIDLIMRCLNNNPQHRARTVEIAQRMADLILQFPPSFENRVEILRRISADITEKRELQQEIEKKASTIEEKQGEVERLGEEGRQQKAESENTKERIELAHSVHTEQLQLQVDDLKMQSRCMLEGISTNVYQISERELQISQLHTEIELHKVTISAKTAEISTTRADLASKEAALSTNRADLSSKEAELSTTRADLSTTRADLASKEAALSTTRAEISTTRADLASKEAALSTTRADLSTTRDDLASKEAALSTNRADLSSKEAELSTTRADLSTTRADLASKEAALSTTRAEISTTRADLASKEAALSTTRADLSTTRADLAKKEAEMSTTRADLASKEAEMSTTRTDLASKEAYYKAALEKKEATNQGLNDQLTRTRDYLTSKPQVKLLYSQCAETPVEMSTGQSTVINGKVYYGRGNCDDDNDKHNLHCYDPSQNTWTTLPTLPLCYFGLGQVKGELVTVGGAKKTRKLSVGDVHSNESGNESDTSEDTGYEYVVTNDVYVFDESTQKWKQSIPAKPTSRYSSAVLSHPSCLVVAGGRLTSNEFTDTVEIYNINTSQWSRTDSLPQACAQLTGTVHNNMGYLMGGFDCEKLLNTVYTASIDKLISNAVAVDQPTDDSNSTDNAPEDDLTWKVVANTPDYYPSAVVISGMVLAIGGVQSSDPSSEQTKSVYAYSPSMDSWFHIGDLPTTVYGATISSLSPTEFIVIGGLDENKKRISTVHKVTLQITIP